jgi:hypothetical protein
MARAADGGSVPRMCATPDGGPHAGRSSGARVTALAPRPYAHAVNLQPRDLPGTTVTEQEHEVAPQATTPTQACAGLGNLARPIAKVDSAKFVGISGSQHDEIRSNVEVMPTTVLATQKNAAEVSSRAISCAERLLLPKLDAANGSRVHFGHATITRLPDPLPGVTGAVEIRIATPILGVPTAIEPEQPTFYIDAFAFLSGPAEVSMAATAFPKPVPAASETRLLALLHSRASAVKL